MGEMERGLQVYTRLGVGLIIGLGLAFIYLLFVAGRGPGLQDVNALECACIARNVARTGHFATSILKPISLARIPRPDDHPDLIYTPLHPLWESLWLRGMGLSDRAIALAGGAWLFLGTGLLLAMGWAWFDPRVGYLAAAAYALNINMMQHAAGGTEAPMIAFFLLLLMAALAGYAKSGGQSLWRALGVGVVAGLLALSKDVWGLSVLAAAVAVYSLTPRALRPRMTLAVLGAFALVLAPWLVRNALVSGDPFFSFRWLESVMHTQTYPGNTLYRTYTTDYPSWTLFVITSPREVLAKTLRGLQQLYAEPIVAPGLYVGALFVAAILFPLGSRGVEISRYVLYGAYGLAVMAMLVLLPAQRLTAPLAAPATLLGVAFFVRLLDQTLANHPPRVQGRYMALAFVALVLLQCFPSMTELAAGRSVAAENQAIRATAQQAAALVDGPVVTDMPWPLAWYGDTTTIWVPKSFEDLQKIQQQIGPLKWLLLTPMSRATESSERMQPWASLWQRALREDVFQSGFRVYRRLPGGWILFQRTNPPR